MEKEILYTIVRFSLFFNLILFHILTSFLLYGVYRKAKVKYAEFVFIPLYPLCLFPFFITINRSIWNSLLWMIPIVNIYFIIRDLNDFFKSFHFTYQKAMLITFIVPFGFHFLLLLILIIEELEHSFLERD